MKGWLKITILVAGIALIVGVFYYTMFSSIIEGPPPISRNSYLELDIFGAVPDRESINPLEKIMVGEAPSMSGLISCIRKAKIDPKIKGIVLRPMGTTMGWAKIEELRDVLTDFKTSGKPVYAYLEVVGNREYYLALVADTIFGSPTASMFINGLMGRGYFIKDMLNKVGIEADFLAHGKYKNAPDMFTRSDMSPAQREVVNALLDDIYQRYLTAIVESRQLDMASVKSLIDRGLFSVEEAVQHQLVDTLMYYNEFKDHLGKKTKHRPRLVNYSRYKKVRFSSLGVKPKGVVAVIYGSGNIVSGIGDDFPEDGVMTSEAMANAIRKAAKDKSVKAIVLRIDSPGGSGTASDIIWREVVEAKKKKPVVVSMSDVAASGGYYISMGADSIVAEPSSLVGSIGVFAGKFAFGKLFQKWGINKEEIIRGKNANLFSEKSKFTPEQKKILRHYIDEFYRIFVTKAAQGRHKTYQEIDRIARGRVWTGRQGVEIGLVDRLGGLLDAVQIAKKMAGIPLENPVHLKVFPRRRSFLQKLLSSNMQTRTFQRIFHRMVPEPVWQYLKGTLFYRDYEPLYLLPFYLEIR